MNLTIVADLSKGGIADYAHDQAQALAARGLDVELLCSPLFLEGRNPAYKALPVLRELRHGAAQGNALLRKARLARGLLHNARVVQRRIAQRRPSAVLTHFSEYLAPLWAAGLRRLHRQGIGFHTVLHDPVRNHVVGPRWWHDWSVSTAFSYLDTAFVHTRQPVELPHGVPAITVPYGIHPFPAARRPRAEVRAELGLPDGAKLLTAFGYIRDNKNIDLVIRALADFPQLHLVVAGSEQKGGNRPVSHYQALAEQLGCAARVHWITRFVSAQETADLLAASDLSVLTYSQSFVSSSAALGVTAHFRLPSLISSGLRETESMVREFDLGIWVEPDSADAIKAGLAHWLAHGIEPRWQQYQDEYSWDRNAQLVEQRIVNCCRMATAKGDIDE